MVKSQAFQEDYPACGQEQTTKQAETKLAGGELRDSFLYVTVAISRFVHDLWKFGITIHHEHLVLHYFHSPMWLQSFFI